MEIFIYILGGLVVILLGIILWAKLFKRESSKARLKRLKEARLQAEMEEIKNDINTTDN